MFLLQDNRYVLQQSRRSIHRTQVHKSQLSIRLLQTEMNETVVVEKSNRHL